MTGVQTCALPICFPVTITELFEEATLFTGDKNLSFKLGEWANPHSLGVLGYLLLHSNNVGDALRRLCRYYPLVGRSGVATLEIMIVSISLCVM